jgi:small subunit ribosomal protein S10
LSKSHATVNNSLLCSIQCKELTGTTSDVFLEYIQRNCPEGVSMDVQHTELTELLVNIPPEAQAFIESQNEKKSNTQ